MTDRDSTPGAAKALQGIRAIEFSSGMAVPWIGRHLACCGAEVIKVESKDRPEQVRMYVPPLTPELGVQPQVSPYLTEWNASKRFIALDLTKPEGIDLCKRLVASCDIVLDNYSAGVMQKLGLGYQVLRRVKEDIIVFSTSGFGDSGPCQGYISWGPNIESVAGLAALSGFPHRDFTMTQLAYPDGLAALHGLFLIMCALDYRAKTGKGQYINLSQLEVTVSALGDTIMEYLANGREPGRNGNRSHNAAPHSCYRCRGEDRWCVIAVSSESQWRSLCSVIARPDLVDDPRFATVAARLDNEEALDQIIHEWTEARDDYEVMEAMQRAGIAAGVVQNAEDLLKRDHHLAARGFFVELDHLKKGKVIANSLPLGLTKTPGVDGVAGQGVGQDNDFVFSQMLGLNPDEITELKKLGVIQSSD